MSDSASGMADTAATAVDKIYDTVWAETQQLVDLDKKTAKLEANYSYDLDRLGEEMNLVLEVSPGQTIEFHGMDQAASTGASWDYQVIDIETGLEIMDIVENVKVDYEPPASGLIGGHGTKIFLFTLGQNQTENNGIKRFRIDFKIIPSWDHQGGFENPRAAYEFILGN